MIMYFYVFFWEMILCLIFHSLNIRTQGNDILLNIYNKLNSNLKKFFCK